MAVSSIGWYIEEPKFRAWFSHEMHAAEKMRWKLKCRVGNPVHGPGKKRPARRADDLGCFILFAVAIAVLT
jgi:hypothetical protein